MNCNPLLPEVWENSYPYYVYLRGYALVYWVEALLCWVVSRYADVDFVLRNPQIFSSASWESAIKKRTQRADCVPAKGRLTQSAGRECCSFLQAGSVAFGTRSSYLVVYC